MSTRLHPSSSPRRPAAKLGGLVGSGDRIGLVTLPFLLAGVAANAVDSSAFAVGGPPAALRVASIVLLVGGAGTWAWSVFLIVTRVPRGELITNGPFALVKHPLYTSVALLVLPWLGFLLDTWLGAALGLVLYAASRGYAPAEEEELSRTFGARWDEYRRTVRIPRL